MELEKRVKILENTYAAVLAEAVTIFTKFGILDKVTAIKAQRNDAVSKMQVANFDIHSEQEVFTKLAEVFNCAIWEINPHEEGFTATATGCKLCALTKKLGGNSPCDIYCLNPMKAMINTINPEAQFIVNSTLWDNAKCEVTIKS
jgi:hypothetical protein